MEEFSRHWEILEMDLKDSQLLQCKIYTVQTYYIIIYIDIITLNEALLLFLPPTDQNTFWLSSFCLLLEGMQFAHFTTPNECIAQSSATLDQCCPIFTVRKMLIDSLKDLENVPGISSCNLALEMQEGLSCCLLFCQELLELISQNASLPQIKGGGR